MDKTSFETEVLRGLNIPPEKYKQVFEHIENMWRAGVSVENAREKIKMAYKV